MLKSSIVRLVAYSVRHPIRVIVLSLVLAVLSGVYVAHHFKINTDISRLIETDKEWSSLEHAMDEAFPDRGQTVLVVVQAPAPEFADAAANALTTALKADSKEFVAVTQPAGGAFFEHNGLLFPSTDEVPVHAPEAWPALRPTRGGVEAAADAIDGHNRWPSAQDDGL